MLRRGQERPDMRHRNYAKACAWDISHIPGFDAIVEFLGLEFWVEGFGFRVTRHRSRRRMPFGRSQHVAPLSSGLFFPRCSHGTTAPAETWDVPPYTNSP